MASYPTLHPDHPLPDVDDPIGRPFWEHCRRHELFIQKSRSSGQFVFPPRPHYAGDFEWERVSGRGRVLTFVIVRPPFLPALEHKVPLAIAVEVLGGLLILLGYFTRPAALVLAGFCVATAVLFHTRLGVRNELLHFEKDLAIAGGLLVLFAHGGGRWSLDAFWRAAVSGAITQPRIH